MLRLCSTIAVALFVLASGARASAAELHLLDRTLAADGGDVDARPAPLLATHLALDAGSGGDVRLGVQFAEIGASFGSEIAVGTVALFALVIPVGSIFGERLPDPVLFGLLGVGFGLTLALPFITSAVVTWIAHRSGIDASYWKVVGWSFVSRVFFLALGLVAWALEAPPGFAVAGALGGFLVAPIAETWAANSGPRFFGGRASTPTTAARGLSGTVSANLLAFRF